MIENNALSPNIGDTKTINGIDFICKGFTSTGKPLWRKVEDTIEKGKWSVGQEKTDKNGMTWVVGALNAKGDPLWRKKDKNTPSPKASAPPAQPTPKTAPTSAPAAPAQSATPAAPPATPQSNKNVADMTPDELVTFAKNATTDALIKVVSDKSADKGFRQLALNQLKQRPDYDPTKADSADLPGGYVPAPTPTIQYVKKKPVVQPILEDYDSAGPGGIISHQSIAKLRAFYAKRTDDELLSVLNEPKIRWQLRQMAYDEALHRGIPEDKINVRGTLQSEWNRLRDKKQMEEDMSKAANPDEAISLNYDWQGRDPQELLAQFDGGKDYSWLDPNSDRVKKVFNTDTLSGRQLYDTFKDYFQRDPKLLPGYLSAKNKINDLNARMMNWAKADRSPMFISAGAAGAGKTFGWQNIVASYLSLPQLKVGADPTSTDWGYVMLEDKDCEDERSLRETLAKYNSSWIDDKGNPHPRILFFDDADKMLTSRSAQMTNLLKRICDNNPENRVFETPNGQKEIWRGKILVTTNKDIAKLSANPDFAAVQSRVTISDIQFTRNETMEILSGLYYKMKLGNTAKTVIEEQGWTDEDIEDFRQEVFDFMVENINEADPRKFTPRTFLQLCEDIAPKWKNGNDVIHTGTGTIGVDVHWRKLAIRLIKAQDNDIEKSEYNEELYSPEAMLKRKQELEETMAQAKREGKYDELFGEHAQEAVLFGDVDDEPEETETEPEVEPQDEETKKALENEMSLDEAEQILFS